MQKKRKFKKTELLKNQQFKAISKPRKGARRRKLSFFLPKLALKLRYGMSRCFHRAGIGSHYANGLVPVMANVPHGKVIWALPSGRKAKEPLLHPDLIQKVSAKCKAEGYNTAVETCGNFCLSPVLKFIDQIDYVLFDIKIIDEEKHIRYCGKSNKKIHRNFETLLDLTDVTPRVPIIPGVNDTPVDIALLCRFFSRYKGKIRRVHILPYHNLGLGKYEALDQTYSLSDVHPPTDKHMNEIKEDLERCGFEVVIGG